jgi:ankyrin repeat protein
MARLAQGTELADAITAAIRCGDVDALARWLAAEPQLAAARIVGADGARSLLHVLTDWPGGVPNGAAIARRLVEAGADVDAPFEGCHAETALHWAASCDDVEVLDALLDLGADVEAPGGVIGGGAPLADAVAFGQWGAARRLVARGARVTLWQAAALGLTAETQAHLAGDPTRDDRDDALWFAGHGGQRETAALLLAAGADPRRAGHDGLTPAQAARRSGALVVAAWLDGAAP